MTHDFGIGIVAFGHPESLTRLVLAIRRFWPTLAVGIVDHTAGGAASLQHLCAEMDVDYQVETNAGFAAGINRLLDWSQSLRTLVVLNPDLELDDIAFIQEAVRVQQTEPRVLALGTALRDAAGEPVAGILPGLGLGLIGFRLPTTERRGVVDVPTVHGAFLVLDAPFLRQLGGLDASLFLYGEEFEISELARSNDRRIVFLPSSGVRHQSEGRQATRLQVVMNASNLLYLAKKWKKHGLMLYISVRILTRRDLPRGMRWKLFRWSMRRTPVDSSHPRHGDQAAQVWRTFERMISISGGTCPE
jgi:GT2 family glycosyltransferase